MRPEIAILRAEVAADRASFLRRLETAASVDFSTGDANAAAAAALALQRAYTALESLLQRVVHVIDGEVPSGRSSHRAIVARAALAIPELRPAVLSAESAQLAQELLGFRHFLHHDYAADIDPVRLAEVVARAVSLRASLMTDLDRLDAWLTEVERA